MRRAAIALPALFLSVLPTLAVAKPADHITITRDEWGIAHVHGSTDADAVYGMIYAQAQDDFPRIERNYLVNLGRLAEAEGEQEIWTDLRQRLFIDPAHLQELYRASPPRMQALMRAWAAWSGASLRGRTACRSRPRTAPTAMRCC